MQTWYSLWLHIIKQFYFRQTLSSNNQWKAYLLICYFYLSCTCDWFWGPGTLHDTMIMNDIMSEKSTEVDINPLPISKPKLCSFLDVPINIYSVLFAFCKKRQILYLFLLRMQHMMFWFIEWRLLNPPNSRDCSLQIENVLTIYSPLSSFKPLWVSLFCWT